MAQNIDSGRNGDTIDTPVGAQWPGIARPGSTDFGRATAGDINTHSETLTAQSPEAAHMRSTVAGDRHGQTTGRELMVIDQPRSRPSAGKVIGSAVAGAVAGSAVPFMLSAAKGGREHVVVDRIGGWNWRDYADRVRSGRFGRSWAS